MSTKQTQGMLKRAFRTVLMAVAAGSTVGCVGMGNTLHNMGETTSQSVENGFYKITGQDMECQRASASSGTRRGSGLWPSSNEQASARQDCIQPRRQMESEKRAAEVNEFRAKEALRLQKKNAEEYQRASYQQRKVETCISLELSLLQKGKVLDQAHPCYPLLNKTETTEQNKTSQTDDGRKALFNRMEPR